VINVRVLRVDVVNNEETPVSLSAIEVIGEAAIRTRRWAVER
jgi:hypothetical protein